MITTNIHNVESIEVAPLHKLSGSNSYIRDITIKVASGEFVQFTMFSNDEENLEISVNWTVTGTAR